MAKSPTHKFGQIIGDLIETVVLYDLKSVCESRGFYLDYKKARIGIRSGTQPSLLDTKGNTHQLDFVIEKNGTDSKFGQPVGFIETAWRNYTKHSKAKAQEMEGAILPLRDKYSHNSPFIGVVLAGIFTTPSIIQLKSHGFKVLYITKEEISPAFKQYGINIIFDESFPDSEIDKEVEKFNLLDPRSREKIIEEIGNSVRQKINEFSSELANHLDRRIDYIIIAPSYTTNHQFPNLEDAIKFLTGYSENLNGLILSEIIIIVKYSDGSQAEGRMKTIDRAVKFLNSCF